MDVSGGTTRGNTISTTQTNSNTGTGFNAGNANNSNSMPSLESLLTEVEDFDIFAAGEEAGLTTEQIVGQSSDPFSDEIVSQTLEDTLNQTNGITLTGTEYEELQSIITQEQEKLATAQAQVENFLLLVSGSPISASPTTLYYYDNLKLDSDLAESLGTIFVPHTNENGEIKYYAFTLEEFAAYVASQGNTADANKYFSEDSEGNLIFNYELASEDFNVRDNQRSEESIMQHNGLSQIYAMYLTNSIALQENLELVNFYQQNIDMSIYQYTELSEKFISYFENYSGELNAGVKEVLATANNDFGRILSNLDYFTDEQKQMIIYLNDTAGFEAVQQYMDIVNFNDQINNIEGYRKAMDFIESLPKDANGNLTELAWSSIVTFVEGIEVGTLGYMEGLMYVNGTEGESSVSSYETQYILSYLQEQGLIGQVLSVDYNVGNSIGNMLIPMMASCATSYLNIAPIVTSLVGNVSFGLSIYGNSYNEALLNGYSDSQAKLKAIISAGSESLTSMFLGGIPGLSYVYSSNSYFANVFSEGLEEGFQQVFDTVVNSAFTGEQINLSNMTAEAFKAALYGMATSAILGAGQNGFDLLVNGNEVNLSSQQIDEITKLLEEGYSVQDAVEQIAGVGLNFAQETQSALSQMESSNIKENSYWENYYGNNLNNITAIMENNNCSFEVAQLMYYNNMTHEEALAYLQPQANTSPTGSVVTEEANLDMQASTLATQLGIEQEVAKIMIIGNCIEEEAKITYNKLYNGEFSNIVRNLDFQSQKEVINYTIENKCSIKETLVNLLSKHERGLNIDYLLTLNVEQLEELIKKDLTLNWPDFGGIDTTKINTLNNLINILGENSEYITKNSNGEIILNISRIGSKTGKSFSIEINGQNLASISERSILNSNDSELLYGNFNYTKYIELTSSLVSNSLTIDALEKILGKEYATINNLNAIISAYDIYRKSNTPKKVYEYYGVERGTGDVNYGFFGPAAAWDAAGTSGGAFQMTTILNLNDLISYGIVEIAEELYDETGNIRPITISEYDNAHSLNKIGLQKGE